MARPLTKTTIAGELYVRSPAVEANIDGAIGQNISTLTRRLEITDKKSPEYLTSECLVHLSREFNRQGERQKRDLVSTVLFCRVEQNLAANVASTIRNAETLREDILQAFAEKLAMDGHGDNPNEMDFFEARFNRAFSCFRIDLLREEFGLQKRMTPLPGEPPDNEDGGRPPDVNVPTSRADQEDRLAYREILDLLPPNIRKAVTLVHLYDYEIESEVDPEKITAATLCNVTGRTIRNWLRQAKQYLPQYKEE